MRHVLSKMSGAVQRVRGSPFLKRFCPIKEDQLQCHMSHLHKEQTQGHFYTYFSSLFLLGFIIKGCFLYVDLVKREKMVNAFMMQKRNLRAVYRLL